MFMRLSFSCLKLELAGAKQITEKLNQQKRFVHSYYVQKLSRSYRNLAGSFFYILHFAYAF